MNRSGMSLVDVLASLCSTITIFFIMSSLWATFESFNRLRWRHEALVDLAISLTLWAKDLRNGCCFVSEKVSSSNHCIFKMKDTYCRWILKEGKLMRSIGSFDSNLNKWLPVSTSTIGRIDKVHFTYLYRRSTVISVTAVFQKLTSKAHAELSLTCAV